MTRAREADQKKRMENESKVNESKYRKRSDFTIGGKVLIRNYNKSRKHDDDDESYCLETRVPQHHRLDKVNGNGPQFQFTSSKHLYLRTVFVLSICVMG